MKNKMFLCAFSVIISCLFIFTGCEPNVDNGNNDTSIPTTPNIPENNNTNDITESDITGSTPPLVTEDVKDNELIENDETQEGTQAVGDETSTAFSVKNLFTAFSDNKLKINKLSTIEKSSINKICWGLGKETDSMNRPNDAVQAQEKYGEYNALFIGDNCNKIFLTFDEGYENGYTGKILDILKEKGVQATFFVTYDYCKSASDLVRRMIDEGHEVANHSYTHASFPECSDGEVKDEIQLLHNYVKTNFDYEMRLVRFPKGEFSERSLSIAKSLGYTSVFWSYAHVDWDVNNQPDVSEIYDKVIKATHPGEIVLLHAVSKTNTECLEDILDFWKDCGYDVSLFDK